MKRNNLVFAVSLLLSILALAVMRNQVSASSPTTEEEVHAALKADNPDYTGDAKVLANNRGEIWGLEMNACKIKSLEPIKGMKLEALALIDNPVTSLAPLKGMALKQLLCAKTDINDLSPIAGMPIWKLDIGNTEVTDLTPLKGMPLQIILLNPYKISKGVEVLKEIPNLLVSVVDPDKSDSGPVKIVISTDEFLKNYNAGVYSKK